MLDLTLCLFSAFFSAFLVDGRYSARTGCHENKHDSLVCRSELTPRDKHEVWSVQVAITGPKALQMLKRYTHLRSSDLRARLGYA